MAWKAQRVIEVRAMAFHWFSLREFFLFGVLCPPGRLKDAQVPMIWVCPGLSEWWVPGLIFFGFSFET